MKVSVKFANGNSMAFLGQGYITSDDKKIYHKGNLIHNVGDTIVDKTGAPKVYTKVKVVSYKVARGEDGELVWAFDPEVIIQKMIGRIYFPIRTLSSKPAVDSEDDVADEEE